MNWSYGVTTVPQRSTDLLPKTLESLRISGFDQPRLFVDGSSDPRSYESRFDLPTTCRGSKLRAYGNWVLALAELWIRNPNADRYAIFQDDIVVVRDLKSYLEKVTFPTNGYLNLYTFPSQHGNIPRVSPERKMDGYTGFYESTQNGRGAAGLVFNNDGVKLLLTHPYMVDRPKDVHRGHKSIDGGIITTMRLLGWKEYVHFPSLIQHMGDFTTITGNARHKKATSFLGEGYSALQFLEVVKELEIPTN